MHQIIPKDDLYYIYDQATNSFLLEAATRAGVIQFYVDKAIKSAEDIFDRDNPYGNLTMSYEDACNVIKNGVSGVGFC